MYFKDLVKELRQAYKEGRLHMHPAQKKMMESPKRYRHYWERGVICLRDDEGNIIAESSHPIVDNSEKIEATQMEKQNDDEI